jgi:ABC-type sugar transport system ATPase subunit
VQRDVERALAERFVTDLRIKTPHVDTPLDSLSGGNQQKVVLARWLATNPRVLILDEPTQGVDVGAKAEIHALMQAMVAHGLAILMISSDLPEVLGMSDRIAVMREGTVVATVDRVDASAESILSLALTTRSSSQAVHL